MTTLLELVQIDGADDDQDSLSLLDYADGFDVAFGGWIPQTAKDNDDSVIETLTLRVRAASHDDLAVILQSLSTWQKRISRSRNVIETDGVWLRAALTNETGARQAQIIEMQYTFGASLIDIPAEDQSIVRVMTLAIRRTPWWEMVAPYPETTAKTNLNCIGDLEVLSETIVGDVPARLARLDFKPAATDNFGRFWLGWRSDRFGNPAVFAPVWPLANATVMGTDTSAAADSSAYNGNAITTTFATVATMDKRVLMTETQAAGVNAGDQAGRYNVLLRAAMSDTSLARVRMLFGWRSTSNSIDSPVQYSRVKISGTSWVLYDLGSINVPPLLNPYITLENFAIQLNAERYSGNGSLKMDCLILMPTMEGFIKTECATNIGTTGDSHSVFARPDGSVSAIRIATTDGIAYEAVIHSALDWSLPAEGSTPYLVAAGTDKDGVSTKGDVITVDYVYVPRWRSLRGDQ